MVLVRNVSYQIEVLYTNFLPFNHLRCLSLHQSVDIGVSKQDMAFVIDSVNLDLLGRLSQDERDMSAE